MAITQYVHIKDDLLKRIRANEFAKDDKLPPERELTKIYGASRMTIRRALDELICDGLLIRKSNSGVYLAKEKIKRSVGSLTIHNDALINEEYGKITTKILELKIVKDHHVANSLLNVEPNDEVWSLKRIQYAETKPIVYERIFLPKKRFKDLSNYDLTRSMNDIVLENVVFEKDTREGKVIVEAGIANTKIAKLLEVATGAPIMMLSIISIVDGETIYAGKDYYDGNAFKFEQ